MLAGRESARGVPQEVVELVRDSFAAGMQWSFRGVALLALGGLVVSVLFVGGSTAASPRPRRYRGEVTATQPSSSTSKRSSGVPAASMAARVSAGRGV